MKDRFEYIALVSDAAANVCTRCDEYNEKYTIEIECGTDPFYALRNCAPQNAALKRAIKEFKYVAGDCEKALKL